MFFIVLLALDDLRLTKVTITLNPCRLNWAEVIRRFEMSHPTLIGYGQRTTGQPIRSDSTAAGNAPDVFAGYADKLVL